MQPHSTAFDITFLRDRGMVKLILTNCDTGIAEDTDVHPSVWHCMLSHSERECSDVYLELIGLRDGAAIVVPGDDQIRSLYNLATTLSCCVMSPLVGSVSDAWLRLPLPSRAGWWHEANSDKPIHAQVLGAQTEKTLFDTQVPYWLPDLIEATDGTRWSTNIYWAYARTPLGTSCIAYLDDEPENPSACLALSDCDISHSQVEHNGLLLARAAVDDLVQRFELFTDGGAVPGADGWDPTGHERLAMRATLEMWRDRVEAQSSDDPPSA